MTDTNTSIPADCIAEWYNLARMACWKVLRGRAAINPALDVDDLIQEAVIYQAQRHDDFSPELSSYATFAQVNMIGRIRNVLKARSAGFTGSAELEALSVYSPAEEAEWEDLAGLDVSSTEWTDQQLLRKALTDVIYRRLTPDDAAIVLYHHGIHAETSQELAWDEIGQKLGLSSHGVKKRYYRVLEVLRTIPEMKELNHLYGVRKFYS